MIFANTDALMFRLDSTLRKVLSRCKGLLDCQWIGRPSDWDEDYAESDSGAEDSAFSAIATLPGEFVTLLKQRKDEAFALRVNFLLHPRGPPECSDFFSLAIDFALTGYLNRHLTTLAICQKSGRPLLDHALRPRFWRFGTPGWMNADIGYQNPLPELVEALLLLGAAPNERYGDHGAATVWSLFLTFIAVGLGSTDLDVRSVAGYVSSLKLMLKHGAPLVITKASVSGLWARNQLGFDQYHPPVDLEHNIAPIGSFVIEWPGLSRDMERPGHDGPEYSIIDVLECLRPQLGDGIDFVKEEARRRDPNN